MMSSVTVCPDLSARSASEMRAESLAAGDRTDNAIPLLQGPNQERQLGGFSYIITRGAEVHPDRLAVLDLLGGHRSTYAQLDCDSNRLARMLRHLGVGKGDLVATMFYNELASIQVMLAIAKIGAVLCPVNVRMLAHEIAEYLAPHGIKAVLCNASFCDRFSSAQVPLRVAFSRTSGSNSDGMSDSGWVDPAVVGAKLSDQSLAPTTSLDDPYRMIPTGGTTGASKGVVHSHGGTLMTVLTNIAEFGIRRGWKTVLIAPTYHGAGMDWGLFPVLWRGGTVIMPAETSFNPRHYLALLREHSVEYVLLVPAVIQPLYDAWDGQPVSCVRSLITTSAPTSPTLRGKLAEMFPAAELMAGAGISESLNMAVQTPADFLRHGTSIGEPHLDTRLCIVNADGRELPRGQPGEICLRGFNTALYYHANTAAGTSTWRRRADDPEGLEWCFTGDIGVMDEDGRVSIVDRSKDIILTGGETVPSIEIENAYSGHPRVRECAAVGLPDSRWGEAITLVVARSDPKDDEACVARELFAFGRQALAGYKVPKQIAFLDALPRSHFGKLLKRDIRDRSFSQLHKPEN